MLFYLTVIGISVVVITLFNIISMPSPTISDALNIFIRVTGGTVAVIALDGAVALIIRRLTPARWYLTNKGPFRISKSERDIYRVLRVKSWKDKIPELGGFTGFHKNKLESTSDKKYLERFILEANYGIVIHFANALLGFMIAFIPLCSSASVWIPIFAVNFVLSMLPVAVLRYTLYTVQNLHARVCRRT